MTRRKKNGELAVPKAHWESKAFHYRKMHKVLSAVLNITDVDLQRSELDKLLIRLKILTLVCDTKAVSTKKGRPKNNVERDDTQIERKMTTVESDISFYKMIEVERVRLSESEIKPMSIIKTIEWYLTEVADEAFLKKYKLQLPSFIAQNYNAIANRYQRGKRAVKNQ